MQTAITVLTLLSLFVGATPGLGAEKRKVAEKPPARQAPPADSVKPEMEKELNGVTFTVYQTDINGRPSRDRAWMLVSNSNAQPVTVTGSVAHSFEATLTGATKNSAGSINLKEAFDGVVEGGQKLMLWYCDRTKAVGTTLRLEGGKVVRIASAKSVHVSEISDLEVK